MAKGNPNPKSRKGVPNKATTVKEIKILELLDSIVDWEKFYTRVYEDALKGDSRSQKLLEERRWGKAPQPLQHSGQIGIEKFVEELS